MGFLSMLSKEQASAIREQTKGFIPQRNAVASNTVPEGDYLVSFTELVTNHKESGTWVTLILEIQDGDYKKMTLPKSVNINDTERLSWFFNELSRLGYDKLIPSGDKAPANYDAIAVLDAALDDLKGKPIMVKHVYKHKGEATFRNTYFQSLVTKVQK